MDIVGNVGPVAIAYQVLGDFKAYHGGIYENSECATTPDKLIMLS